MRSDSSPPLALTGTSHETQPPRSHTAAGELAGPPAWSHRIVPPTNSRPPRDSSCWRRYATSHVWSVNRSLRWLSAWDTAVAPGGSPEPSWSSVSPLTPEYSTPSVVRPVIARPKRWAALADTIAVKRFVLAQLSVTSPGLGPPVLGPSPARCRWPSC